MSDIIIIRMKCACCTFRTKQYIGFLGPQCSKCGFQHFDDLTWPDIVRERRRKMKLTRRQMGERTGYSRATVKRYEYVRCTDAYIQATEKLIRGQYRGK